jgi:hypothetical protein
MRFRLGWSAALAFAFSGFIFACGISTFSSAEEDGGSADDASSDRTIAADSPSSSDDGSAGDADDVPDAMAIDSGSDASECDAGSIVNSMNHIICPLNDMDLISQQLFGHRRRSGVLHSRIHNRVPSANVSLRRCGARV